MRGRRGKRADSFGGGVRKRVVGGLRLEDTVQETCNRIMALSRGGGGSKKTTEKKRIEGCLI